MKCQQTTTGGFQNNVIDELLGLHRLDELQYSLNLQIIEIGYFPYHRPGVIISLSGTTCSGKSIIASAFQSNHPNAKIIDIKNLYIESDFRESSEILEERMNEAIDAALSSNDVVLCNVSPEMFVRYLESMGLKLPIYKILVFCPFFQLEENVENKNQETEVHISGFRSLLDSYNEYSCLYVSNSSGRTLESLDDAETLRDAYFATSSQRLNDEANCKFIWPFYKDIKTIKMLKAQYLGKQPSLQQDFESKLALDQHFGSVKISSKDEYDLTLMNNDDEDVILPLLSDQLEKGFLQFLGDNANLIGNLGE